MQGIDNSLYIFFCQPLASIKSIARISTTWNFLEKQSMVVNGTGLVSILNNSIFGMAQSIIWDRLLFFVVHFEGFTKNYPFLFEGNVKGWTRK
jgi:hypothetical protein